MKSEKPVIIWLVIGAILVAAMVVVGGITRLTNSGLSMVEWKLIMGSIPPTTEQEWQTVFEKYQQFPEYQKINTDYSLGDFKSIYWWEYSHRMLGRFIGIVFLLPFIYFLVAGYLNRKLILKLTILFLLGGFQGFLGWYMVKSGLVDRPDVSHYRLAIHLSAALVLLSYIVWLIMSLTHTVINKVQIQIYYKTMWFIYGMLLLQIVFGAFVAGLNAGKFHNTFPLVDGQWIPSILNYQLSENGVIALVDSVTGVQFIHRWLGMFLFMAVIGIYINYGPTLLPRPRRNLRWLMIVVISQAVIGVITLLMAVPFSFAIIHQFIAVILIVVMVINLYGAKPGFPEPA